MSEQKQRKSRGYRIPLTTDGNENTKRLALDAIDRIERGYQCLLRVLNGRVVRGRDKTEYPLAPMSDGRMSYVENLLAEMHESAFTQLRAGRRNGTTTRIIPD